MTLGCCMKYKLKTEYNDLHQCWCWGCVSARAVVTHLWWHRHCWKLHPGLGATHAATQATSLFRDVAAYFSEQPLRTCSSSVGKSSTYKASRRWCKAGVNGSVSQPCWTVSQESNFKFEWIFAEKVHQFEGEYLVFEVFLIEWFAHDCILVLFIFYTMAQPHWS